MQSTGREQLWRHDTETKTIVVGLFPPAYVAFGTRFLRTDIGIKLLVGRLFVNANVLRKLAVGVVLDRAAAVKLAHLHVVRQLHHHAITKKERPFVGCFGRHLLGNAH